MSLEMYLLVFNQIQIKHPLIFTSIHIDMHISASQLAIKAILIGMYVCFCCQHAYSSVKYPGGRLNKKDGLTRYGNSNVKDKTVSPTVLSLTWESPYLGKTVFILRRGPDSSWILNQGVKPVLGGLIRRHFLIHICQRKCFNLDEKKIPDVCS